MTNAPLTTRSFNWRAFLPIALTGFAISLAISFGARAAGVSRPLSSGLGALVLYSSLFAAQLRATGVPLNRKSMSVAILVAVFMAFIQGALMSLGD